METPRLNRELVLEERQRTPDGAGGYTEAWVALGTLWADLRPGSGREEAFEGVTLSSVGLRIIVRAAPPGAPSRPRPDQRFREGDRRYRIVAVTERDPSGRYLTCFAHEEVAA